jgi:hypothetical protein
MLLHRLFSFLRPSPPPDPSLAPAEAANENLLILGPGEDPAVELSIVRFLLARMQQDNARFGTLLADPRRRRDYEEARALEQAIVWNYFR